MGFKRPNESFTFADLIMKETLEHNRNLKTLEKVDKAIKLVPYRIHSIESLYCGYQQGRRRCLPDRIRRPFDSGLSAVAVVLMLAPSKMV